MAGRADRPSGEHRLPLVSEQGAALPASTNWNCQSAGRGCQNAAMPDKVKIEEWYEDDTKERNIQDTAHMDALFERVSAPIEQAHRRVMTSINIAEVYTKI